DRCDEQVRGEHDDGRGAASVCLLQEDPDLVAVRQARDHEQAHAARDRDVDDRRGGQSGVDRRQVLRGQADTAVGDVHLHVAAVEALGTDQDLCVVWGEGGRVLHELGHQVDHVVDRASEHRDVGGGAYVDPLVLLDLGNRTAQYVHQRDRLGPFTGVVLTRQNQQVLVVAAHTRCKVVQLEQVGQTVGVLLGLLQTVDQAQLPLDQGLTPAGEVD